MTTTREEAIWTAYKRLRAVTLSDLVQQQCDPDEFSALVVIDALAEAGLLREDNPSAVIRPWYWRTIVLLPFSLAMVVLAALSIAVNGALGWLAAGLVVGTLTYWAFIEIRLRRRVAQRRTSGVPGKWTGFSVGPATGPARPRRLEPPSLANHTRDMPDRGQGANRPPASSAQPKRLGE